MKDLEQYLVFAKDLAEEAGGIIYKNFLAGPAREWKEDRTPLTATDTQINSLVISKIKEKFPEHSVLGEEESYNLGGDLTWVCDPVDGTMPFSHALQISTFSLALVQKKNGQPIVGVVYDPYIKRMFWAVKDQGAYLNGEKIQVSANSNLDKTLIDMAGIPVGPTPVIKIKPEFVVALEEVGVNVTHLWSIILPSVLVAAGQYTATIFNVPKPEDGAAVKLIVEEAGGKVTDLLGKEQRYDGPIAGFLASNGKVHQELLDLMAKFRVEG